MRAVTEKLNSKRGATIILALLFFLIAAIVGSIILASASSNAGRLSHMREEQQTYLTVSSAARLLGDELRGQSFSVVTTTVTADEGQTLIQSGTEEIPATGTLSAMINAWVSYNRELSAGNLVGSPPSGVITVESAELERPVTGEFYMDGQFNVKISFPVSEGYAMVLTCSSSISDNSANPETIVDTSAEPETTTTIATTKISWGESVITKGGA